MTGISLVICTYNGELRLPKTLEYISKLRFEGPWELLIVDNASKDNSNFIAREFFNENPIIQGKVVFEPKAGLTNARQKGWRTANYDIVLFCDDDNWLCSDYLTVGYSIFKSHSKVGILGGCGEPVSEVQFPDWFAEFSHSYAVGNNGKTSGKLEKGAAHYGAGCFFLRKALLQLDQLETRLILTDRKGNELVSGGDVELCYLVQLLGYDLWFESKLKFQHFIPLGRLDWQYYLKLKKGIASSFPLLFSYKVVFMGTSKMQLRAEIILKLWYSFKGYLLCQYRIFASPTKRNEVQLIENSQKLKSFFKNYKKTLSHFEWLNSRFD